MTAPIVGGFTRRKLQPKNISDGLPTIMTMLRLSRLAIDGQLWERIAEGVRR